MSRKQQKFVVYMPVTITMEAEYMERHGINPDKQLRELIKEIPKHGFSFGNGSYYVTTRCKQKDIIAPPLVKVSALVATTPLVKIKKRRNDNG